MGVLAGSPSAASAGLRCGSWRPDSEIREFLTSRRARITPEQAG